MSALNLFILGLAFGAGCLLLRKWPRCTFGSESGGFESRRISLIIPARNEEANLAVLLGSLKHQRCGPDEVIVVDDDSDDATADVARRFGATVIKAVELPAGWCGKNWALHHGVQAASSEILFFLDADTFFAEPDGYQKIRDTFTRTGGALSIQAYHLPQGWIEQLSAFFNLIMAAATRSGEHNSDNNALVGLSLLISREDYARIGGHEAVKNQVLENLRLGQRAGTLGLQCRAFSGKDALYCRMYAAGFRDLFEGWSKAFFQGAAGVAWKPLVLIVLWITGLARAARLLLLSFFSDGLDPWVCVLFYALFAAQSFYLFNEVGRFRAASAVFYPIGLLYFFAVFCVGLGRKLLGNEAVWKGRRLSGNRHEQK